MRIRQMKTKLFAFVALASLAVVSVINAETYTVQPGDTLSGIAVKFATTVESLAVTNGIQNVDLINVDQILEIGASSLELQEKEPETTTTVAGVNSENPTAVTDPTTNAPVAPQASAPQAPQAPQTQPTQPQTNQTGMTEAQAKEEIAYRESRGSYTARNGQYYGRYQLTITYLNGDLSPENQERVADAYVANRYGSWVAALAHHNAVGWY